MPAVPPWSHCSFKVIGLTATRHPSGGLQLISIFRPRPDAAAVRRHNRPLQRAGGSMFVEALSTFYHYCDWATQRVLRAAADLTPAEWLEQGVVGQDSVRDTLVHLISAQ